MDARDLSGRVAQLEAQVGLAVAVGGRGLLGAGEVGVDRLAVLQLGDGGAGHRGREAAEFVDHVLSLVPPRLPDGPDGRRGSGVVTLSSAGQMRVRMRLSLIHISEPTRLGMISYAV